jgi:hypothetical protein
MSLPDTDTRLIRKPDLIASDMDGDLVMMSIDRGEYYGISGVGVRIWALLAAPTSAADIAATLAREFDVDVTTALRDSRAFLAGLLSRGLVTPC